MQDRTLAPLADAVALMVRERLTGLAPPANATALVDAWRADIEKSAPATASLATLLRMADVYLALPDTHPNEWRFVARLLGDPKQLLSEEEAERTAPILGRFLREMQAVFERAEGTEALEGGDGEARVYGYWAALHGAHCMEKVRRVSSTAPAVSVIGRFTARALLASWGATSARLAAAEVLASRVGQPADREPSSKSKHEKKKGRE
jgi:hypothetical protein